MYYFRLAFVLSIAWGLSAGALRRDGAFWVQTIKGSERVSPNGRLRVICPGRIVFHGLDSESISYEYRLKVRAKDESSATALLRHARVKSSPGVVTASGDNAIAELQISAPRTLSAVSLITRGGSIEASDLEGSLRAEAGAGKIAIDRIGGDVEIRTAGGLTSLGSIGGLVQCLSGGGAISAEAIHGGAILESAGGDILIHSVEGQVRAFTGGGGIHIMRAGGAVIANTAGGPIQVDRAFGMVTAKNSGGPIQVGYASGVSCESASGAIRVNNVSGSMRASTGVGSIVAAYLAGRPALDSFLSTGSGDITVWIPSDLSVTIRAHNEASGNVRTILSEFPGIAVRSEGAAVTAEGRINGGGPLLRLAGNGGTIFIKRGK